MWQFRQENAGQHSVFCVRLPWTLLQLRRCQMGFSSSVWLFLLPFQVSFFAKTAPHRKYEHTLEKLKQNDRGTRRGYSSKPLKATRPSFFFWGGGYHPTLKLSGIPTFTFIVSLTHRMDNIKINLQYNITFLAIGVNVTPL